jgi:hypothetical protein
VWEKGRKMLRRFGHVERIDERRLTKKFFEADVGGIAGKYNISENVAKQYAHPLSYVTATVVIILAEHLR